MVFAKNGQTKGQFNRRGLYGQNTQSASHPLWCADQIEPIRPFQLANCRAAKCGYAGRGGTGRATAIRGEGGQSLCQ